MQQTEREAPLGNRARNDRESIWTIPTRLKRWYFALFSIQVIIATVLLARAVIADEGSDGISAVLFYIWQFMAPAAVTSATFALVIVDTANGIMVLSTWLEEVLENRKQRQIKAAADNARAEVQSAWMEWNQRRVAAADLAEEFNEPPPGTFENHSEP